jgi:hypothetical protein
MGVHIQFNIQIVIEYLKLAKKIYLQSIIRRKIFKNIPINFKVNLNNTRDRICN